MNNNENIVIKKAVVGYLEENCYLIKKGNVALLVDPGEEIDKIISMIGNTKIIGILITHAHFDHIGALDEVLDIYKVPVYYCNKNKEISYENLIDLEEKNYSIASFRFNAIYTPGHRNDHMCFYFYEEDIMFTGDFLFKESIGRTDLEYGNNLEMLNSIEKIKKYNNDIKIYPGHGDSSSLDYEKNNNMFFF